MSTSHDSGGVAYVYPWEGHELRFYSCHHRPADSLGGFIKGFRDGISNGRALVTIRSWLVGIVYYKPVQILIDAPRLPRLNCRRLRISSHLQVLVAAVPISGSAGYTFSSSSHESATKKISAPIPDSIRNLMTACRNNLLHKLDIANPFPPDL